jgi:hypothetical protein
MIRTFSRLSLAAGLALALLPATAQAQVTPAAPYTPPDDTPSIKVGAVIFANYTYQQQPTATDSDGNTINPNSFNAPRAYINVTGNISHLVAFRITPDVTIESTAGSALNGSMTYRLKYAFAQVNLDDWMPKGSWIRFGMQQTPWIDFTEGIYRYRFQGTVYAEREGYLTSSDAGVSFHATFPSNYGDVHVGIYNGEGYSKQEANDQKAIQIRATLRPFATGDPVLRGLRVTGFFDGDNYVKSGEKKRAIAQVSYEHKYLNLGLEYLSTKDQSSIKSTDLSGKGFSVFATPKFPMGWEALLRYDRIKPATVATATDAVRNRSIVGLAYWFPHQGNATYTLLFDYEQQTSDDALKQVRQQKIYVHSLISF